MNSLNKYLFMARRVLTDINENKTLPINEDNHSQKLGHYYFLFSEDKINSRGGNKPLKFDENGVPQIHSYMDVVEDAGYYYYPITIGQYALAVFHSYLESDSKSKEKHFLSIANWFRETAIIDEKLGAYWLTSVPKPEFNLYTPWKSAFAQSRAISVCMRAWQITGDKEYYNLATLALKPFLIDIQEGGVMSTLNNSDGFYEEYAHEYPTRILAGHLMSLLGIFDFIRADAYKSDIAINIFNKGVDVIINHWTQFKMKNWLKYSLVENRKFVDPCTMGYIRLTVHLLNILHDLSDKKEIQEISENINQMISIKNLMQSYVIKFRALKKLNRL